MTLQVSDSLLDVVLKVIPRFGVLLMVVESKYKMSHNCLVVLRAGGHKDYIFLSFAIPFLCLCVRWHPGRDHSHQDEGDHLELFVDL